MSNFLKGGLGTIQQGQDDQRPLFPTRIGYRNDRHFVYTRIAADRIFQIDRGNPFASGFDQVFRPVSHLNIAAPVDRACITCPQPAIFGQRAIRVGL